MWFKLKKHIIFHILYIIVAPFWNTSIVTKLIVLRSEACSDWPATLACVVMAKYLIIFVDAFYLCKLNYNGKIALCILINN